MRSARRGVHILSVFTAWVLKKLIKSSTGGPGLRLLHQNGNFSYPWLTYFCILTLDLLNRVLDSISEGKKLAESRYQILNSETQSSIRAAFTDRTASLTKSEVKEEEDIVLLSLSQVAGSSPVGSHTTAAKYPVAIDDCEDSGCDAPIVISSSQ